MKIVLHEIEVRKIFDGYQNTAQGGVIGYGGKLNIRPEYQREFVYKDAQRDAVIDTIRKDFPLNVMYWVKNENETFEVLDGQQRTISICEYINKMFSINYRYFFNLSDDEQKQILDYKLKIYICEGSDSEKLEWFKTINIAGEKLTNQELRNAVYSGTWLTDAKVHFSKNQCPAYAIGSKYLSGTPIRQDYLEATLSWINKSKIEDYMATHQKDSNANALWLYFQAVIAWVEATFIVYRKEMKGVEWGFLYNLYKDDKLDPRKLEEIISKLMQDDDVTNKKGIYEYVLDNDEKHLNVRVFSDSMKRSAFTRQKGICPLCGKKFDIEEMEGDHIKPWHAGGKTEPSNCQMLCRDCNRKKSGKLTTSQPITTPMGKTIP